MDASCPESRIAKAATALPSAPKDLEEYRWVDFGPGAQGARSHVECPADHRGRRPVVFLRRRVEIDGHFYRIGWKEEERVAGYSERIASDPRGGRKPDHE